MKEPPRRYLLAILFLLLAGTLNHVRFTQQYGKPLAEAYLQVVPETTTLNLLLGGFRGVVADWLWLRAMILQEQGRFVEIVQLAEWITALQPQFPDIWSLHAWNLAYNITVLLPDGQARWQWVLHGYRILRDRAIPATRLHPQICAELAWILMHKIGGRSDDFADLYFANWVAQYAPLLDPDGHVPLDPEGLEGFRKEAGLPAPILQAFEALYGPHDWRHPLTHAAAWAFAGMQASHAPRGSTMAARLFPQIYRQLLLEGQIARSPNHDALLLEPDFDRWAALVDILIAAQTRAADPSQEETDAATLEHLAQVLVAYEYRKEARQTYAVLTQRFPQYPASLQGYSALAAHPVTLTPRLIKLPETMP